MKKFSILIQSILALALTNQALASNYKTGPLPSWVEQRSIDAIPAFMIDSAEVASVYYQLVDQQYHRANARKHEDHARYVVRILNKSGVNEASRISLNFLPEMEELTIHHVDVIRNGKRHDRLRSAYTNVIRQESELWQGIYNGQKTLILDLNDIQVGDVIDYSYTKTRNPGVRQGQVDLAFRYQFPFPVGSLHNAVTVRNGMELQIQDFGPGIRYEKRRGQNSETYVWQLSKLEALRIDQNLPPWVEPYPYVQISSFKNWQEVAAWANSLFQINSKGRQYQAVLSQLQKEDSLEKQVIEAIRLTQSRVRYLGIEIGNGGFVPRQPEETLDKLFGDCKDKSLLLVSLLRDLGVDASPVLVHSSAGPGVKDELPSIVAFNHAIVQFNLGEQSYWVDPTVSSQGGSLANLAFPDLGYGLVLRPGTKELTRVYNESQDLNTQKVQEEYLISNVYTPVHLTVTTEYVGLKADQMRWNLGRVSRSQVRSNLMAAYARTWPKVKAIGEVSLQDHKDENRLVLTMKFEIPDFFHENFGERQLIASFQPGSISGAIANPGSIYREANAYLGPRATYIHEFKIALPQAIRFQSDSQDIDTPWYNLSKKSNYERQKIELSYTLEQSETQLAKDEVAEYHRQIRKIHDVLGLAVTLPMPRDYERRQEPSEQADLVSSISEPQAVYGPRNPIELELSFGKPADSGLDLVFRSKFSPNFHIGALVGLYETGDSQLNSSTFRYGVQALWTYSSGFFTSLELDHSTDTITGQGILEGDEPVFTSTNLIGKLGYRAQFETLFLMFGLGIHQQMGSSLEGVMESGFEMSDDAGAKIIPTFGIGMRL